MIIDGKKIAAGIIDELKTQPRPKKFLAAFLIGENPASLSFLHQKEKIAKEIGVDFRIYGHPMSIDQDTLRKEILKIASHKTCGGVIVQLPLPESVSEHYVLNAIPREKDIDVLGERALGAFYTDRNPVLPPAVGVVKTLIENCKLKIENSRIAVVGRGILVGRPAALWLMDKAAELAVFASRTKDLGKKLKDADVIISGVGKANLFGADDLKDNALVIDFGYDFSDGKISGDFNASPLEIKNSKSRTRTCGSVRDKLEITYTPTPGGTGPILAAELFLNFYILNHK